MAGNANSGARPKPRALRVYEGNPSDRPLPDEPEFRAGVPDRPKWMPRRGKEFWAYLVAELGYVPGLLQRTDRLVMELICSAYAEWRELDVFLRKEGRTYQHEQHYIDANGTPAMKAFSKPRPEVKMRDEAHAELVRLLGMLGLSPSHRAKLIGGVRKRDARSLLDHVW